MSVLVVGADTDQRDGGSDTAIQFGVLISRAVVADFDDVDRNQAASESNKCLFHSRQISEGEPCHARRVALIAPFENDGDARGISQLARIAVTRPQHPPVQSTYPPGESAFGGYDSGTARPEPFDGSDVCVTVGGSVKDGSDAPDYRAKSPRVINIEMREHEDVDVGDPQSRQALTDGRFGSPGVDERNHPGVPNQNGITLAHVTLRP